MRGDDATAGGGRDLPDEIWLGLTDPAPGRSRGTGGVFVLAVSDEPDEALLADPGAASSADLILACGDLPFDYLGSLMNALDVPLVFVPGNHDPDLAGYQTSRAGLTLRAGMPVRAPWPDGAINADGRVVDVAGLRIAGLGGCLRYSGGPNQYTDREQAQRAMALRARARWHRARHGAGPVDVLITHAPPRGAGDEDDPPHHGFTALHGLTRALRPRMLLHGHVQPRRIPVHGHLNPGGIPPWLPGGRPWTSDIPPWLTDDGPSSPDGKPSWPIRMPSGALIIKPGTVVFNVTGWHLMWIAAGRTRPGLTPRARHPRSRGGGDAR